jgi:hypothetical protein
MWFQARRIRVQFPCPPGTLVEPAEPAVAVAAAQAECPPGTVAEPAEPAAEAGDCPFRSCRYPSDLLAREPDVLLLDPADLPVFKAHLERVLEQTKQKLQQIESAQQELNAPEEEQ